MISRLRVQPWLSSLRSGNPSKIWKLTNVGIVPEFKWIQSSNIVSIGFNRSFLFINNSIYGRNYSVTLNGLLPEEISEPLLENDGTSVNKQNSVGNEHVLSVKTFRRKKTKLKKSKRRQRRKKIRRLSERKRKKRNY
mgnify:CR=1 FL=1